MVGQKYARNLALGNGLRRARAGDHGGPGGPAIASRGDWPYTRPTSEPDTSSVAGEEEEA